MNIVLKNIWRTSRVLLLCLIAGNHLFGQAPYINSISTSSAAAGETITISGTNFTGVTNVKFGGANGNNLNVVSDNLIEIDVPTAAAFDNIIVSHPTNGQAYSNEIFNLNFVGTQPSTASLKTDIENETPFTLDASGTQTQDLCACDFDGDGKIDAAVSNAGGTGSSVIDVYGNNSTINTITFNTSLTLNTNFPTVNIACGDINGDQLPDLIASEGGSTPNKIYIYANTSTGIGIFSFGTRIEITIPNGQGGISNPARLAINDIDLDGKSEIIVTMASENFVDIFENQVSNGIDFSAQPTRLYTDVDGFVTGLQLNGLDVKDLNNDGLPEIAVCPFQGQGLFVFQNSSEPGSIAFENPLNFTTTSNLKNIKIGDLDQNGFADVVLASHVSANMTILRNTTSTIGGDITFSSATNIGIPSTTWGLDLNDIDGDGDLDIAAAAIGSQNAFVVMLNTDPANISSTSFGSIDISTVDNSRNMRMVDLNGDGKPDFLFTHNSKSGATGQISAIKNPLCITPSIAPSGSIEVCAGGTVTFEATSSAGHSYQWILNGADIGGAISATYTPPAPSDGDVFKVRMIVGSCSEESNSTTVNINAAAYTPPTFNVFGGASCQGVDLTFDVTGGAAGETYLWTGPNGFTDNVKQPNINPVTATHAGAYTLNVTSADGCISAPQNQNLVVTTLPVITVNSTSDVFCTGSNTTLTTPNFSGYTYQWNDDSGLISGETSTSLNVTTSGNYSATISGSGCDYTSGARAITSIAAPTASPVADNAPRCVNLDVDFTANAQGENGFTLTYLWDFDDAGATSTVENPMRPYTATGSFTVILTPSYAEVDAGSCNYPTETVAVTITNIPTDLNLIKSSNTDDTDFDKCPSGDLTLSLAIAYDMYTWQSRLTPADSWSTETSANSVTIADTLLVQVLLVDNTGCGYTADAVEINNLQNSGLTLSSSTNTIENPMDNPDLGNIINLDEGQREVTLTISNGTGFAWSPAALIDDTTAATVRVIPVDVSELITIIGIDNSNCIESDSVTLLNQFVRAKKNFSPNGDQIGDCWEITNSRGGSFSQCTVTIFDSKGRNILELQGPYPDDCIWNGNNQSGNEMPEGIYYYALRCAESSLESAGSILLAR